MQLFNYLKWHLIKKWKNYLGTLILLIMVSIFQLLPPKIVGVLVDFIMKDRVDIKFVLPWIIVIITTAIFIYFLRCGWRYLLFSASYKLSVYLRVQFYKAIIKKNLNFYIKNKTGDLITRVNNDIERIVFAAGEGVLTLIDSFVMSIFTTIAMCQEVGWKLTFFSMIPMPFMVIIIKKYGKFLHQTFYESQRVLSLLNNKTQDIINNIKMIKTFGLENKQLNKFFEVAKLSSKSNIEVTKIDSKFDPVIYSSIAVSNFLAISGGGYLVWNQIITLGKLTSFIMYLSLMVWPMLALAWMFNIVERGTAAWKRIQKVMNSKYKNKKHIKIKKNSKIKKFYSKNNNINIKIKKFSYLKKTNVILKNIFFKIPLKQKIGICGPTGSGKSTLLSLIQKNLDVCYGEIFYKGKTFKEISQKYWKKKISVVNQKSFLFSDTIYNNISLGKKKTCLKEVIKFSKLAKIHEEIIKFPSSYNTKIGEHGILLSGGQKQRISIARALISQSKILILDDSLSALDANTEKSILKNLNFLRKKYKITLIICSHKLSSISDSNKIIILKNGKIEDKGTHKELMKKKNWYNNTYKYQNFR
ncbi:ABC transporter transmembrane domain-containing protein [Buchnera aphidicola]|uniref:ABC transporter transmembrane domain-containing protein n=1 Tax=Buchnera aphidicola TaxID=9 RepID=UPI0030ED7AD0